MLLPRRAAQENRTVRLRTLGPGDILYVLIGGGGNTLALMRDDGVVVIDTKLPGWGMPIREAIEAATDRPVTTIINTHAHPDHAGGNKDFPGKVEIVAHANAAAAVGATRTVTDKLTLLSGPDQIDLYYFGRGHTNGDLVVVFPQKRLAYLGDLFPSKSAPIVDAAAGGSVSALADTLRRVATEIKGVTRVVTGHRRRARRRARSGGHLRGHLDPANDAVERRRRVRRLHARLRRRGAQGEERRQDGSRSGRQPVAARPLSRLRHAERPGGSRSTLQRGRPMSRFRLADLGPGLLLAAAGIGVGDMVSSIIAGAEYGLTLIWALAAGVLVKYAITEGAARWQLATDRTLVEGWRDNLPSPVLIGFFVYFVIWSYMVASALVSASALVPAAVFPSVSVQTWGMLHAVAAFAMVYFGRYEQFLAVVKWFIAFKVLAVIATVLLIIVRSGADWSTVGAQLRLVRRLRAVAHRRHRRHRDAALVRLLDAGRRLVGSAAASTPPGSICCSRSDWRSCSRWR